MQQGLGLLFEIIDELEEALKVRVLYGGRVWLGGRGGGFGVRVGEGEGTLLWVVGVDFG